MEPIAISVTRASRSFADCISRARYQGVTFTLVKGRTPVALITPVARQAKRGGELAAELQKALEGVHIGNEEATSWLHDLEQARGSMQPQVRLWRS